MNLEIFSCSGGMSEGFRRAGIVFDMVIDKDPAACASYGRNHGHRPLQMDVNDFARMVRGGWRPPAPIDLFVADPPCTPWSRAGKREGREDERDCLEVTAELITLLRPRAYLIGNVPGLQDQTNWWVVQEVIGGLARHGYCVADYASLDAADFGVPQHRVRPFWFGHLDGPCLRWPARTHGRATQQLAIGDHALVPYVTCRQALQHLSLPELGRAVRMRIREKGEDGTRHGGDATRCSAPDKPATTVVAKADRKGGQILIPTSKHPALEADQPSDTVRSGGVGHAPPALVLAAPAVAPARARGRKKKGDGPDRADFSTGTPAAPATEKPPFIPSGGDLSLCSEPDRPAKVVTAHEGIKGGQILVPHAGAGADELLAHDHHPVSRLDEPALTVTAHLGATGAAQGGATMFVGELAPENQHHRISTPDAPRLDEPIVLPSTITREPDGTLVATVRDWGVAGPGLLAQPSGSLENFGGLEHPPAEVTSPPPDGWFLDETAGQAWLDAEHQQSLQAHAAPAQPTAPPLFGGPVPDPRAVCECCHISNQHEGGTGPCFAFADDLCACQGFRPHAVEKAVSEGPPEARSLPGKEGAATGETMERRVGDVAELAEPRRDCHPISEVDEPSKAIVSSMPGNGGAVMRLPDANRPPADPDEPHRAITGARDQAVMAARPRRGARVGDHERPGAVVTTDPARVGAGPGQVLEWPWNSPATTITGDERLSVPGHHDHRIGNASHKGPNAVVLSERAAAILQGFPDGECTGHLGVAARMDGSNEIEADGVRPGEKCPECGLVRRWHFAGDTKKDRWSQIGQAMPPGLAEPVARAIAAQMAAARGSAARDPLEDLPRLRYGHAFAPIGDLDSFVPGAVRSDTCGFVVDTSHDGLPVYCRRSSRDHIRSAPRDRPRFDETSAVEPGFEGIDPRPIGSTCLYSCSFCGRAERSQPLPPPPALGVYPLPHGWVLVPVRRPDVDDKLACKACAPEHAQ